MKLKKFLRLLANRSIIFFSASALSINLLFFSGSTLRADAATENLQKSLNNTFSFNNKGFSFEIIKNTEPTILKAKKQKSSTHPLWDLATKNLNTAINSIKLDTKELVTVYNIPLDLKLQLFIINLCKERSLDPTIIFALIEQESAFKSHILGDNEHALGLMQIQPWYQGDKMKEINCMDLLDPYQNVMVGMAQFFEVLEKCKGNSVAAIAAYHDGFEGANQKYFSKGIFENSYSKSVLRKKELLEKRRKTIKFKIAKTKIGLKYMHPNYVK